MSARLTVVLDDEGLYREAKVRAAREGVPLKAIIEAALGAYLSTGRKRRPITRQRLEQWFAEADRMDAELPPDTPTDLSDVKHHLYGWPKRAAEAAMHAAEETVEYGP